MNNHINLTIKEIEEIQVLIWRSVNKLNDYLSSKTIASLEQEIADYNEIAWLCNDEVPFQDYSFANRIGADIFALKFFINKHKDFIDNLIFLELNIRYSNSDNEIQRYIKIKMDLLLSGLGIPLIRNGII